MKYLTRLGLAIAAAAALTAFAGANAASATILCSEPGTGSPVGTTCPKGKAYPKGQEIHAVIDPGTGGAKLKTEFKTIECSEITIKGKTETEGSATETVDMKDLETLTFSGCNCEVVVLTKGFFDFHWISGTHNATLKFYNNEWTTTCSTITGLVHCIYQTSDSDLGTLTGGKPSTFDSLGSIPRLATDGACAKEANWEAKLEITTPNPLYVADHT